MTDKEKLIEQHNTYHMPNYAPGLVLVKGKGSWVWDIEGNKYLDFLSGIAVTSIGHCHPVLVNAIRKQAGKLMHVSNLYYNENQPRLAKALAERSLKGKCFFCNSGAEANEGLIKLARLWGHAQGRYEIISMQNSFHGRTLATLTATGQEKVKVGFDPLPEGFVYAPFNDISACAELVSEKTAAILVEPVQGEGGVRPADAEYMKALRELCDEKGVLLLCDEVQCGVGRTGHWFGYQAYEGVVPDAIALAKGLGGGFPIGAVVAGPKLQDVFQPGTHATTFGGTPLACSAALAVVQTIEKEDLLKNVAKRSKQFMDKLQKIADKSSMVEDIRGLGLMIGMVMKDAEVAKDLQARLEKNGLLGLATAGNVMRFLPPLTVSKSEISKAASLVKKCVSEVSA